MKNTIIKIWYIFWLTCFAIWFIPAILCLSVVAGPKLVNDMVDAMREVVRQYKDKP